MQNDMLMSHDKLWINNEVSYSEAEKISLELGISKLISLVFLNRGINDLEYIRNFINPSLKSFHDPFLLKDMDKAVDRICCAIENKERIVIYGDYDVDGITSTSILMDYLSGLGALISYYIPDRMGEGYGLSEEAIEGIAQAGTSLIITVDCGITAIDEVAYAKSKNVDVIITDHHECMAQIPEACAVIDPWRPDCTYPFKELAGVGVVFKLINAMNIRLDLGENHLDYLELTALGTIADVSKLTGENRIIAKYGMDKMESTSNIGLKMLIENSGLKDKTITTYSVGFVIAPKVNAAGRIGDAARAVSLFTGDKEEEALRIALELGEENKKRQTTEQFILQEAFNIVESDLRYLKHKILVISGEHWHKGVIGIVSSRVTERYQRPSILIATEDGIGKGSGRSIEGFNLFKALTHCQDLLDKYGGHELAAGLTVQECNIDLLRETMNRYADSVLDDDLLVPRIKIDAYIEKEDFSLGNAKELQKLAPFGPGNPGPVFAFNNFIIKDIRTVGQDKHLKLVLNIEDISVDAIGFNMGELAGVFKIGDTIDAAFSLDVNLWNNTEKMQLILKDIKTNGKDAYKDSCFYKLDKYIENNGIIKYNRDIYSKDVEISLEEIIPNRKDLEAVYLYLKRISNKDTEKDHVRINNIFMVSKMISKSYGVCINYFKLKRAIEIFEELGLLEKQCLGKHGMYIALNDSEKKTNLENSKLYKKLQEFSE